MINLVILLWDFGDASRQDRPTVTHTFANPRDYQVSLTVIDTFGKSDASTWIISIIGQADSQPPPTPVAVIIAPPFGYTDTPVLFDGSMSQSDAGITSYSWRMGNSVTLEGAVVEYL